MGAASPTLCSRPSAASDVLATSHLDSKLDLVLCFAPCSDFVLGFGLELCSVAYGVFVTSIGGLKLDLGSLLLFRSAPSFAALDFGFRL